MTRWTSISVSRETAEKLRKMKVHPRQPFHELIDEIVARLENCEKCKIKEAE